MSKYIFYIRDPPYYSKGLRAPIGTNECNLLLDYISPISQSKARQEGKKKFPLLSRIKSRKEYKLYTLIRELEIKGFIKERFLEEFRRYNITYIDAETNPNDHDIFSIEAKSYSDARILLNACFSNLGNFLKEIIGSEARRYVPVRWEIKFGSDLPQSRDCTIEEMLGESEKVSDIESEFI